MCNLCNDTGVKDSGGVTPWGEQIDVPCECSYKWYNVIYYTLSDCKNSVDVLANSAAEAEIIARRKDECFDKLISCAHLPYKDESRRTPHALDGGYCACPSSVPRYDAGDGWKCHWCNRPRK